MIYNHNAFWYLFLFLVFIILSFFVRRYKYIPLILPFKNHIVNIIQYFLIIVICLSILLLPFNIGVYQGTNVIRKSTLNIEVLFDVSLSMTADDFKPDRFFVAKQSLKKFISKLDVNYNIGIIAFSGQPFVYSPITNNKKALIEKINNMKMGDFPPALDFVGTAIGDAMILGVNTLLNYTNKNKKPGVIILFTDGDSNKGEKPDRASDYAKKYNVPVFVGAIGKNKKYIVGKDFTGRDVPTNIDIDMLKLISKKTGGIFLKIESKEDFLRILSYLYHYVKNYEKLENIDEYFYINYYIRRILLISLILYIFYIGFHFSNKKK